MRYLGVDTAGHYQVNDTARPLQDPDGRLVRYGRFQHLSVNRQNLIALGQSTISANGKKTTQLSSSFITHSTSSIFVSREPRPPSEELHESILAFSCFLSTNSLPTLVENDILLHLEGEREREPRSDFSACPSRSRGRRTQELHREINQKGIEKVSKERERERSILYKLSVEFRFIVRHSPCLWKNAPVEEIRHGFKERSNTPKVSPLFPQTAQRGATRRREGGKQ